MPAMRSNDSPFRSRASSALLCLYAATAILAVSESLSKELRLIWDSCTQKEFNVGYDCGSSPWAFNEGLSANLVGRMVAAGVSFRVTLYPDRAQDAAKMQTDN